MTNAVYIIDSNTLFTGSAKDNTQTDNYALAGTGDIIVGIGGNLIIAGAGNPASNPPSDSDTTILLTQFGGGKITGVTDTFTLDGSTNSLSNSSPITGSTISFTVRGNGGNNAVDLANVSSSTVNVNIGVDSTATNPAGNNDVAIDNMGGANNVDLGGPANMVTLNGDATNTVKFAGGGATVQIGSADDDNFGQTAKVTFAGTGNTLHGGDETFTVSGSASSSTVSVGDGNNSIAMGGGNNHVTVWGGNNNIAAGGSGAVIKILGLDGNNTATPTDTDPGAPDDASVPLSPTDNVILRGAGDSVSATYENVNIDGVFVTIAANIQLGNGNNAIVLGGVGNNVVTVGNGANVINATGNNSHYNLGSGANGVTLSGNNNVVNVTDAKGVGLDIVQLGAGVGDTVNFDHAGGSVTGTGTGTTTINQAASSGRAVTVNLNSGTGIITLGNGKDTITANGPGTSIKAGNGNDTATANGAGDTFVFGNGNDIVTANGGGDKFTFGNGNDSLTANGNGDTGVFGTPGAGGNDMLVAKGSGDTWTFNEKAASTVTATLGSSDTLNQTNGALNATLLGNGDTVNVNNVKTAGTTITANGNGEVFDFSNNSGGNLTLNPSSINDLLTFNGASNDFKGTVVVSGLSTSDQVHLDGLFTTGGVHITSFATMLSAMDFTPTGDVLNLLGGGEIKFAANTPLSPASFHFA